jgi:putative transposase
MPSYRRAYSPGGTFFFTIVTDGRAPLFNHSTARRLLRSAIAEACASRPFRINSIVLLPGHLHLLMTLPEDETDYSTRIAHFKARFTRTWVDSGIVPEQSRSKFRQRTRRRGVWQPRFWDLIRDQEDYNNHLDYISYNPIKHGHAACPHSWPFTTFHRHVRRRLYDHDWCCTCNGRHPTVPTFDTLPTGEMELEETAS